MSAKATVILQQQQQQKIEPEKKLNIFKCKENPGNSISIILSSKKQQWKNEISLFEKRKKIKNNSTQHKGSGVDDGRLARL